MADSKKCAHPLCNCVTNEKYCSQHCQDSKNMTMLACQCGHQGCSARQITT